MSRPRMVGRLWLKRAQIACKDVADVVEVCHNKGLWKTVARIPSLRGDQMVEATQVLPLPDSNVHGQQRAIKLPLEPN